VSVHPRRLERETRNLLAEDKGSLASRGITGVWLPDADDLTIYHKHAERDGRLVPTGETLPVEELAPEGHPLGGTIFSGPIPEGVVGD
jgi:hypothetical protein